MRLIPILIIFVVAQLSCTTSTDSKTPDLSFLMSGESFVDISIDNKSFYPKKNQFLGKISISDGAIQLSLSDIFMGNIQIELTRPNALKTFKEPFKISTNPRGEYNNYGNVLIGKKTKSGFEGYTLSRAIFTWVKWSKEIAILKCEGFLVSPGKAIIPENEIPFNGYIYFKSPSIITNGIDPNEVY